jgi:hypothetical protein
MQGYPLGNKIMEFHLKYLCLSDQHFHLSEEGVGEAVVVSYCLEVTSGEPSIPPDNVVSEYKYFMLLSSEG